MGRKNGAVRRRNSSSMRRRQPGEPRLVPNKRMPPEPLEKLVLPDGQCNFPNPRKAKARFATPEKAQKALEQAQRHRARTGSPYTEKRYYKCPEGGCGGYHLTSRDTFEERRLS